MVVGVASIVFAQRVLVEGYHHYKTGVVEAIIYHGCAYILGGVAGLTEANLHIVLLISVVLLIFVAIRFIDLICSALSVLGLAGLLFTNAMRWAVFYDRLYHLF